MACLMKTVNVPVGIGGWFRNNRSICVLLERFRLVSRSAIYHFISIQVHVILVLIFLNLEALMPRGPKPRDEIGKTYNKLTVIAFSHSDGHQRWYDCQCICGNMARVQIVSLRNGHTKSCGCALLDRPPARLTHGLRHTPEYQSWAAMKARCFNPKNPKYARYGGRGITVCPQWINSFETFYADMGPRPSIQYTLGRKENDEPYSPDNCRWETAKQQ